MSEIETLQNNLNPSIEINKICLSYVTRIFPEFKDTPYIVLYKKQVFEFFNDCSKCINDNQTTFDITGSPLKYTFEEEDDFEDTMILMKQNWYKEEEKYLPLSRTEACTALNTCIECINNPCPLIFALCDGKDNKESRLLGTCIEGEWFTTVEVCSAGTETFEVIKNSSSKILQQHLEISHACEQDIIISVFNIFELFGIKEEMINWDYNKKSYFEGSLSVEVDSCSLSSYLPSRTSKNKLIAQIATNSCNSPLKELWKQLLLLNEYLNIIEDYTKNIKFNYTAIPLEFPHDFSNPYKEEHSIILNNLDLLLNGNYSYRNFSDIKEDQINFLNEENLESNLRIQQYVKNLSFRHNLDFTDYLWELLIMNSSHLEMTECIHTVFEEIIANDCLPQVNFTNSTKFSKLITNLPQQNITSHLLSGSLPLQYVIDMGFEKLYKDYMYILISAKFGGLDNIQEELKNMSDNEFTIDSYRKKLIYLTQIHICLEFMLILQDNLECSSDDLRALFCHAFRQYVGKNSPIKHCNDLLQNRIYNLTAPLPISTVSNLSKQIPSIRRISLSSQSKLSKLTTIKYYSDSPIFPTNIYPLDKSNVTNREYYVINAICSSNKFK